MKNNNNNDMYQNNNIIHKIIIKMEKLIIAQKKTVYPLQFIKKFNIVMENNENVEEFLRYSVLKGYSLFLPAHGQAES